MILLWTCLSFGFLCLTSEQKKNGHKTFPSNNLKLQPDPGNSTPRIIQLRVRLLRHLDTCDASTIWWIFFLLEKSQPKLRFVGWRCVCVCLKFVFWLEDIWQLSDLKFAFSYGEQGFEMCWSSIMFLYTFLSEWFTPILCDCVQYEVALFRPSWTWVLLVVTSQYSQPNKQGFIYEVFFVWNCQWIISRLSQDYIFSSCLVLLLMIASFDNRF